jgi:hypothetical protein
MFKITFALLNKTLMENEMKEVKDQDVDQTVLVVDKIDKKVSAVSKVTKKGTVKKVPAKKKRMDQFIRLDRNGDLFSNFFSNFMSQANNPSRFSFIIVPKSKAVKAAEAIKKSLKEAQELPLNEIAGNTLKQILNHNSMETSQKTQEAGEFRYNPEQVNWASLANMGLNIERLEKSNLMEQLLKGFKTNELVPLSLSLGSAVVKLDARLSLQTNDSGEIVVAMHGIRKEPNLNYPFFGHEFSNEDKDNLLKTGNMGRVVDLYNQKTAEYHPSMVSVDRMTNELVAMRTEWIKIPDEIKGVKLDEQQKQQLMEGKQVFLEGMTSTKGKAFDANVQYNADKRYVEFQFDRTNNKQEVGIEAPRNVRGKELDDEQYQKFKDGQTIYVSGLQDKQGKEYKGYVTFDKESGKIGFSFTNPDLVKEKIQPAEEHKTQTAVNSEGKTNEATKHSTDPLKSGQVIPDSAAQAQQQEGQEPAKSKGRKM